MDSNQQHTPHRKSTRGGGGGHDKHKQKQPPNQRKGFNKKAFSVAHPGRKARDTLFHNSVEHKRHHVQTPQGAAPSVPTEAPPMIVAVQGPPGSGKSTLIKSLVKKWTKSTLKASPDGPITIVAGKSRRVTLIECGSDVASMIDVAKVADLCLLTINAEKGFEMETFEFINILQVHGFPKVIGVLTHLEGKDNKMQRKLKKKIKARFWVEVYAGAKLFYCSGVNRGKYPKREIVLITRTLSVVKFRPITWRSAHPYVLLDRFEREGGLPDNENDNDEINIVAFGYVRGTSLRVGTRTHFLGVGDFDLNELTRVPDPCPLPERKERALLRREALLYAPMLPGVGNVVFDNKSVYVTMTASNLQPVENEATAMVKELRGDVDGGEEEEEFELFNAARCRSVS